MESEQRYRIGSSLLLLMLVSVFSGCRATTGAPKVSISAESLARIKKLGVYVIRAREFSAVLSRDKKPGAGGALFGAIGAAVELSARSSADRKVEQALKPLIQGHDSQKEIAEKISGYLRAAHRVETVEVVDTEDREALRGKGFDGLMVILVDEWGLRLCKDRGSHSDDQIQGQGGVNARARLLVLEDNSTVWKQKELYRDGECHTTGEYQSQEGLLRRVVARAIDNYARKTVNEAFVPATQ